MSNVKRLLVFVVALLVSVVNVRSQSITAGNWNLRPYLELGVAYDDNVLRSAENETDDTYLDGKAGLLFQTSAEATELKLSGGALYSLREYADLSDRNSDSYGAGVSLDVSPGEKTAAQAIGSYRLLEDEETIPAVVQLKDVERGLVQDINANMVEREVIDTGLSIRQAISDRTALLLGGLYTSIDYDPAANLDLTSALGQGVVDYTLTDKLAVFGLARGGRQEQDGDNQTADTVTGQVGASLNTTDKISIRAGAGVENYTRSTPGLADEKSDNVSLSLSLNWIATDKVKISAGGYNGSQLSSSFNDNAVEFINAFAGVQYALSEAIDVSLQLIYRTDDYVNPVTQGSISVDRKDDRMQYTLRINYRPPVDYVKLFAQVSTEDVDSTIDPIDYTRTAAIAGASLAY